MASSSDGANSVVQTVGLTKTFKDFWRRDRVMAVRDLNLEIRRGEVFGLLGPNGSGKSTTIKMLLGLLYPSRGRISVFGRPPTDVEVKGRIGFLPEESHLYRFLDARETLDLYGRLFKLHPRLRVERTEKLLEMVGLKKEARRRIGEYSKGMARRIGLAQALINDPEFLILDEPTAGLDPIGMRQIKDVIRELGEKGKTVLLSSHLLADVEDICDRVCILYGGQVQAEGTVEDLLSQEDRTQIITDKLRPETIQRVESVIRELEPNCAVDVGSPTDRLENFFMKTVERAQASNIQSAGAQAGGALPDFLGTTQREDDIVSSLVSASAVSHTLAEPVPAPSPTKLEADKEARRGLIDQLTKSDSGSSGAKAAESKAAESKDADAPVNDPPAEVIERKRKTSDADRSVIDGLLNKGKRQDGE